MLHDEILPTLRNELTNEEWENIIYMQDGTTIHCTE